MILSSGKNNTLSVKLTLPILLCIICFSYNFKCVGGGGALCVVDVFCIVGSVPLHFCPCVFYVVSDFEDEFCPFSMRGLFK